MPGELGSQLRGYVGESAWIFLVLEAMCQAGYVSWRPNGGYSVTPLGREHVASLTNAGYSVQCIEETTRLLAA